MKYDMEKKDNDEAEMKRELAAIKRREILKERKKKGMKKFFSRTVANSRPKTTEAYDMASPSPKVGTIAPPSMADANYSMMMDDSSDESESLMSDSMFSTNVSVNGADGTAPQVETVMSIDSSSGKSSKKQKPPVVAMAKKSNKKETPKDHKPPVPRKMSLTDKMRKVQSMDPRIATAARPAEPMKRTISKLLEQPDGAVELETVDTDDTIEDEIVSPKSPSLVKGGF